MNGGSPKPGWSTAPYSGLTPLNGSQPFGVPPGQPVNPLNPLSPTIPRPSGPNVNGFYEPKSISDLQYGR